MKLPETWLAHYGVRGMKWGVRRTPEQLGHRTTPPRPNDLAEFTKDDSKLANKIAKNFRVDRKYGGYVSEFNASIGGKKVPVRVTCVRKGDEIVDATDTVNFLKRYDISKAKEGVAKEFYDDPRMGFEKDPTSDDYISRDDFKRRISPYGVYVTPQKNYYSVGWDDDDMCGGHSLDDEGSLDTMKVWSRSMNG